MIRFKCPNCARILSIDASKAGAVLVCPVCSVKLRVPAAAGTASPPQPAPERKPLPSESAEPKVADDAIYGFESPPVPPPAEDQPQPEGASEGGWTDRSADEPKTVSGPVRKKKRKKRSIEEGWEMPDLRPLLPLAFVAAGLLVVAVLSFVIPPLAYVTVGMGYLLGFGGSIWLLHEAFQESIAWGLACLFIPCANLLFLSAHVERALKPFLLQVGGGVLVFLGWLALGAQA